MAKVKSSRKVEDLRHGDEHIIEDHDPESNGRVSPRASDSEESEDENAGTEHYVKVGKGSLRQKDAVALGRQYRGSRVSRRALEDENSALFAVDHENDDTDESDGISPSEDGLRDERYDNPDLVDLEADEAEASDSEIDSGDALGESDAEHFKSFVFRGSAKPSKKESVATKRATAADFMSTDEEEELGGATLVDEEEDEDSSGAELEGSDGEEDLDDGLDDLVNGGAESEDSSDAESGDEGEDEDMSEEEEDGAGQSNLDMVERPARPTIAAPSITADVDKGLAIQQQRQAYDGLLNLRIRLQKALIAANTLATVEADSDQESAPYEAAEEAAIKLLNTMCSLGDRLTSAPRAGSKRKRALTSSMSTKEIWDELQRGEDAASRSREERLEKWSRKVQSVNVTATRSLAGSRSKTLVSALQEQLMSPESRLVKRTWVPRSCAPAQAAKKVAEDPDIYDDADFYQQLLKELVDQRTIDSISGQATAVPSVMLTAAKEAKLRKNVDRKASKGRKMRFTVHEKLQNFTAPEDRRSWEQGAIDRFFGALFGRKLELNEDDADEMMSDGDAEEAGLRLFRN